MRKRPNVLVFFTDQQRWDTVGRHGNPLNITPNFDHLSREGCFVRESFTCQPVCTPARAALQTGRYQSRTGVYRNDITLPLEEHTLGHHFREHGYSTGYIGKWHLASDNPVPKDEQAGYDYWLASNILEFTSTAYETTVYEADGTPQNLPGYRVDALTDAAIRWMDQSRDDPFFLFLSFLEPHHQNQTDDYPAPSGIESWLQGRNPELPEDLKTLGGTSAEHYFGYMGMISRLDAALGRIADMLRSRGMLDDTIVLFSSDHGCHFKTRNDEYKRSCHEASIRVPTFIRGPGFEPGSEPDRPVSLIDLPPTLLDAAGITPPDEMQGRSILSDGGPQDIFIQISESHVGRALRTGRWKYEISGEGVDGWDDSGASTYREAFLYDLETDPHELNNLVGDPGLTDVRAGLRERLLERMVEAGEDRPEVLAAEMAG
ncbi:sulfatase-like hydrolase/transferase [Amaricoccus tamworthensis]|uniref:sulfatase-like hydrolase/transferase n=1 Tax=Amaricoccus tamworthensis TaxID=57002 RepID=UPI003C7CA623